MTDDHFLISASGSAVWSTATLELASCEPGGRGTEKLLDLAEELDRLVALNTLDV